MGLPLAAEWPKTTSGTGWAATLTVRVPFSTAPFSTVCMAPSAMVYTCALVMVKVPSAPAAASSFSLNTRLYRSPLTPRPSLVGSSRDTA